MHRRRRWRDRKTALTLSLMTGEFNADVRAHGFSATRLARRPQRTCSPYAWNLTDVRRGVGQGRFNLTSAWKPCGRADGWKLTIHTEARNIDAAARERGPETGLRGLCAGMGGARWRRRTHRKASLITDHRFFCIWVSASLRARRKKNVSMRIYLSAHPYQLHFSFYTYNCGRESARAQRVHNAICAPPPGRGDCQYAR